MAAEKTEPRKDSMEMKAETHVSEHGIVTSQLHKKIKEN